MSFWNRLSISWKVFALVLGVVAGAVAGLAWFSIARQQALLESGLRDRGDVLGHTVAGYCAAPLVFEDTRGAQEILGQLMAADEVESALLVDRAGRTLAGWTRAGGEVPKAPAQLRPAGGWVRSESGRLWSAFAVSFKNEFEGTLLLALTDAGVTAERHRSVVVVGELALLMLALGGWLGWMLQHRLTQPLRALVAAMGEVREKRALHLRVPEEGRLDELGSLYRGFNAMLDDLQEGQAEREASENYLRSLIRALPDLVCVVDRGGRFVDVPVARPAVLAFDESHSLAGRRLEEALPAAAVSKAVAAVADACAGNPRALELELPPMQDRPARFLELVAAPLPGVQDRALLILRDATSRRLLEAQLQQAHKMEAVGQLAGGIAHDFNNLLAAIMGCADMLAEEDDPEERRTLSREILEASTRGAELIAQLLAFSRRRSAALAPVDLHQLIARVVRLAQRTFDRRIEMRQQLGAARAVVEGDATQLESAILNLAVNARDAMPEGGALTFATREVNVTGADSDAAFLSLAPGRYVELSVTDTGAGIPPDVLPRIFEPFFTTKPIGKGSGLGLAAVYGTVKSHRGNVKVYSQPGQGTVFRLFFPAAQAEPVTLDAHAEDALRGSGRVLVVDDEATVRNTTSRMLRGLGYEVEAASSGAEALLLCDGGRFDALVLDLMMPGMTGVQVLQRLREKGRRVPTLLVSGFDLSGSAEEGSALAEAVLQKPFTLRQLAQKMQILVAR
jgi:signal transduction histidine kinase